MLQSGLNNMAVYPSTLGWDTFKLIAKLITPIVLPFGVVRALAQYVGRDYTQLTYILLGEGGYPEFFVQAPVPFNTHFPGPYEVYPDRPAVDWDATG